eukprot:TRINITY_DN10291_c0_g3_i2.p3 TRINITY_DN10291_c0_g3~~TRINITY_DN10291_c0_g3_i2.p3  ORF type:complete len:144 (+),score=25.67 TRINITY_DN10291_c0_g3_i2:1933-2364(+)
MDSPSDITNEQWGLFFAIVVQIATVMAQQAYTDLLFGVKFALSSRSDEDMQASKKQDATPAFFRFQRCVRNGVENLVLFTAAILLAQSRGHTSSITEAFAIVYPVARAIYSIAYVANIIVLRSLAWFVGLIACIAIAIDTVSA